MSLFQLEIVSNEKFVHFHSGKYYNLGFRRLCHCCRCGQYLNYSQNHREIEWNSTSNEIISIFFRTFLPNSLFALNVAINIVRIEPKQIIDEEKISVFFPRMFWTSVICTPLVTEIEIDVIHPSRVNNGPTVDSGATNVCVRHTNLAKLINHENRIRSRHSQAFESKQRATIRRISTSKNRRSDIVPCVVSLITYCN